MARTENSASFSPDAFLDPSDATVGLQAARPFLEKNDFRGAIIAAFALSERDAYTYHAMASVSLAQVQSAVDAGPANRLHAWYIDDQDADRPSPPLPDIEAYVAIFAPGASAAASLTSFSSNARKGSLRKEIAEHLISKRHVDAAVPDPRKKKKLPPPGPANPSFDFWAWTCRALEWAGPTPHTARLKSAHHVLPVMMHHFGCVTPSEEALGIILHLCRSATLSVVEVGSGNGYWTLMLRCRGVDVLAVDNGQSAYRTLWIADTLREDGVRWLKRNNGARDRLLLLVYPITAGDWTAEVLRAYKGDHVCVVGTQNQSGYTGFSHHVVDDWMSKEHGDFRKVVQIPLPSFAGKDEALFLFQRQKT